MTTRCRRCGGSLLVTIDPEDGSRIGECISCGELAAWEDVNDLEPVEDAIGRQLPVGYGWTAEADAELLRMHRQRVPWGARARRFGKTEETIRKRLRVLLGDPQEDAVTPQMTDWVAIAKQELAGLLSEIADVTEKQRRAERIIAALTAWGDTSLPELPWKAKAKVARGGAARRWTANEDTLLTEMYHQGRPRSEIARALNRPLPTVYKRAQILGLTEREAVPA